MNVLLFGPPGIGKSTLIGYLRANPEFMQGYEAIDLEEIYPSPLRFDVPSIVENTIMGAADLDPKKEYPGTLKILLWLPQDRYAKRRAMRDQVVTGKAGQAPQNINDWDTPGQYDFRLFADGSVPSTARTLRAFVRKAEANPRNSRSR